MKVIVKNRWVILSLIALAALLPLLIYRNTNSSNAPVKTEAAKVESVLGSEFQHVTLTAKAVERLGVETVTFHEEWVGRSGSTRFVVPYASVIYGLNGETWVYTNPKSLVFTRRPIIIDYIDGDLAVLSEALPPDTKAVTVGVAELYGIDTGIGK